MLNLKTLVNKKSFTKLNGELVVEKDSQTGFLPGKVLNANL